MRCAVLLVVLAGCSSESAPSDLAVSPDLVAPACNFMIGTSDSVPCFARYCHQSTSDTLVLTGDIPPGPNAELTIDGAFMAGRRYSGAELKTWDAGYRILSGTKTYVGGNSIAGSSVSLAITELAQTDATCGPNGNGTAHGELDLDLVESVGDGGAGSAGPPIHVHTFF